MATGEGKTLVATLPVFLNALTGMGVHLVTVNNYLARRDAEWNAPLFQFHGITVDCIDLHQPNSDARRKAYRADITYGTNNEFGFDYLRDNMTTHPEFLVQRNHYYAIIDEIDSVLIDEARTPLIISGPVPRGDKHEYNELKPRIDQLVKKQRRLIQGYLNDAKKKLAAGDEENGGLDLFRAFRGLPKNGGLVKYLQEPGMKVLLQKVEGVYLQDNKKRMPEADEPLFFTIDEKNNQIELTDKGRDDLARAGEDADFFVLPDITAEFSALEGDESLTEENAKLEKEIEAINWFWRRTQRQCENLRVVHVADVESTESWKALASVLKESFTVLKHGASFQIFPEYYCRALEILQARDEVSLQFYKKIVDLETGVCPEPLHLPEDMGINISTLNQEISRNPGLVSRENLGVWQTLSELVR